MTSYLNAIILGIVEGLTEFLPISSTGHLIISGHLLGFTGPKADTFEIIIQLGAILSVVVIYWRTFLGLLNPAWGPHAGRSFRGQSGVSGIRGIFLLFLTCLPAALTGLLFHSFIKNNLFSTQTVALALCAGALAILAIEQYPRRATIRALDEITPALALGIGLFQCLSLWPGFSRSAATIMGAMLLGTERKTAAEYSFISAVPLMFAATGYEMYKNRELFSYDDLNVLAVGFVVSFFAAWLAVKTFIRLLGKTTLRPFAWYRLILAPMVLWIFW